MKFHKLFWSFMIFLSTFTIKSERLPIIYSDKYDFSLDMVEEQDWWKDFNFKISSSRLIPPIFGSSRYKKINEEIKARLNLDQSDFYSPKAVTEKELILVHSKQYLESVEQPEVIAKICEAPLLKNLSSKMINKYVLSPMRYATGGTILGAELALQKGWAINIGGGFHHAKAQSGSGFCVYADIPIAIKFLRQSKPNLKVLVIDLDVHQGNGVSDVLKDDSYTYILDVYNKDIYPKDYEAQKGINFDFPLRSYIKDKEYLGLIQRVVSRAIETTSPDLIIYNAGTDIYEEDPLGAMSVSSNGVIKRDYYVFKAARNKNIPILMLLSGGYSENGPHLIADSIINIINNFS